MPSIGRETLDIVKFNTGLITELDQKDIPNDAGTNGTLNLDPNAQGKLTGMYGWGEVFPSGTVGSSYKQAKWLERNGGEKDLVGIGATGIEVLPDYYSGSTPTAVAVGSLTPTSIQSTAHGVYIGNGTNAPYWVGYNEHQQFGLQGVEDIDSGSVSGDDDMTITGTYDELATATILVRVKTEGTPDIIEYNVDGAGYTGDINCSTSATALVNGLYVQFDDTDNHTAGDIWDISLADWSAVDIQTATTDSNVVATTVTTAGKFWANATGTGTGGANFTTGTTYKIGMSVVLDDIEESLVTDSKELVAGADYTYISPYIYANDSRINQAAFNQRITRVKVYMAEKPSGGTYGYYRLIKEIDINDSSWAPNFSVDPDTNLYTWDFYNDGAYPSYEAETGVPETLETIDVNYGLSAVVNNSLFVGDCTHDEVNSAYQIIFKSQLDGFSVFDYTKNLIRIPFTPKAMVSFNGRLYVFDTNRFLRINPDGLYVEDEYEGAGCESQLSFVVTEYGLFFANDNGIYMYDGKQVHDLTTNVIRGTWQSESAAIYATQDVTTKQVLFSRGGGYVYAFHTEKQRWDIYSNGFKDTVTGVFMDLLGHAIFSSDGGTGEEYLTMFFDRSVNRRAWTWVSKEFMLGDESQLKKFYVINVEGTYTTAYFNTAGAVPATVIASLSKNKAQSIRLKVVGATGATAKETDSVSIVYRRMVGKR